MTTPPNDTFWALTDKEKQTLRLIVRGHDAKSVARNLGLSVHTINERLRDARRKMAVSSSREAARLLLAAEAGAAGSPDPELFGDTTIRAYAAARPDDNRTAPIVGAGWVNHHPRTLFGVCLMTLALGILALTALPQALSTSLPDHAVASTTPASEVVDIARQWLLLLDQGRWDDSYNATGASFRKLSTPQVWAAASDKARMPLGAVISRTFASQESLPAPPYGYEVIKFRTSFANKADAIETVSLDRENGTWRVTGVLIE